MPLEGKPPDEEGAAFIIRSILEAGGHPDQPFVEGDTSGVRFGGKTGTSYGFRDAWAVGGDGPHTWAWDR